MLHRRAGVWGVSCTCFGSLKIWKPKQLHYGRYRRQRQHISQAVWGDNLPRIIEDIPRRLPRNLVPGLGSSSRQVYDFLFPDGFLAPAPWTSYATVALLAGLFIELTMRFLTFLTKEPMSEDEVARIERELAQQNAQADRQEAIRERREELLRQARLEQRLSLLREQRRRDMRQARAGSSRSAGATVPDQANLEEERFLMRDYIVAERWRGLGWLAGITAFAIWCTGILNKDTPLAP